MHSMRTLEKTTPWSGGGPGLLPSRYFSLIGDKALRGFFDRGILSVLDPIFGGEILGDDLQTVAQTLIDLNILLGEEQGRRLVLELLEEPKRAELEERVGNLVKNSDNWSAKEVNEARGFFDLIESSIVSLPPTAVEELESSFGLFEYQRRAVEQIMPLLMYDKRRAVLHFPTGAGKTRTAMHIVARFLSTNEPSVVVWLASTKELLEQAVDSFKNGWAHLGNRTIQFGSMWGEFSPDLSQFEDGFLAVGLAKGWATARRVDPDWAVRMSQRVSLVVFDEAHQSVARTYQQITEELTLNYQCSLLGLTATPGRTWADIDEDGRVAHFYAHNKVSLEVPDGDPVRYLIEMGYLAKPRFRTMLSESGVTLNDRDLASISNELEIPNYIVESLTMNKQYVMAIVKAVQELVDTGHKRILVFAATVDHARTLVAILLVKTIQALLVLGSTDKRTRERNIRTFKTNDANPMVLVNYGVLTTGFDAPKASAAIIARPTKSLVLYSQMVGRVTRGPKAGGTDTCEIVTVIDPALSGFSDIAEAFNNWEDVWR